MAPKLSQNFEDSLLIIKPDYMHKKKQVLLFLTTLGYQLQGRRLVAFTPEHAAEFYKDGADESWFMLQVILLSKGNSEAFIWCKDNCVEDLYNTMICYFRSSNEMDRFVHVTQNKKQVRHEITFIFPNYIYEPIPFYDKNQFCKTEYIGELIGEIYEIVENKDSTVDWKEALAEHLLESNPNMPKVLNECTQNPTSHTVDTIVQTSCVMIGDVTRSRPAPESPKTSISKPCASSSRSSRILSSSSCISCGKFSSDGPKIPCADVICGRVTPLDLSPRESEHIVVEEAEVEIVPETEVYEYVPETIGLESAISKEDDFFSHVVPTEPTVAHDDLTVTDVAQEPTEAFDDVPEPAPAEPISAVEEKPPAEPAPEQAEEVQETQEKLPESAPDAGDAPTAENNPATANAEEGVEPTADEPEN